MRTIIIKALCLLVLGCQSNQQKNQSDHVETALEEVAVDLKDVSLADLEGNPIKISDFEGKVVFLNFWSTWCKPCIAEMPSIDRAIDILAGKDVVFLAASDESVAKIKRFKSKYDFDFEYVRVLDDFMALQVYALPTTVVYHRNGEVVYQESGAREWDADDMINMLSSL